ncbi:MAG: fumarate/nitrate reduction transcriptional regulator Fnr [Spongiibacteraceae bacterium]
MKNSGTIRVIGSDRITHPVIACTECMLKGSCFPIAMESPNIATFDAIVQREKPLRKDEYIIRAGQPFTTIYAVRSGSFKAYSVSESGEEQITQFYLPGEILGMDGLSSNRYATSVVALETSSVCAIPFEHLQKLSGALPMLQRHMFQLMSQAIVSEQEMIMMLGKYSADRRIAFFLETLSRYQIKRKLSARKIRVPMSRTDIGNYLGLTIETVSRIISRFQKIGLLNSSNREIEILNIDWLHELANGESGNSEKAISNAI